jgi:hypothetical protein
MDVAVGCGISVAVAVGRGVRVDVGNAGSFALDGRGVLVAACSTPSLSDERQAVVEEAITSNVVTMMATLQNLSNPFLIVLRPPLAIE